MDRDSRGGRNRKRVNEDFFKTWSPKMAYVLGFIYADGAVEDCRKSSRTCYLLLSNNDLDLLSDISKAMSAEKSVQIREPRLTKIKGKAYWCKTSYLVRIGNKKIYEDLIQLGLCPRKSLVIQLPEIPKQFFSYFLRGYFDGDGCINIEKTKKSRTNIIFTSGSKIFIDQLAGRIQSLYPILKSSVSNGNGAFQLRYNWRNALMVADFMYQDVVSAPYLKYKYIKYIKYLDEKNKMKTLKESRSKFLKYLDETYHPNFVYYPACGADKTPKQIFGENMVIHLSLPENEDGAKYLERLGSGIKLLGDMTHSPIADNSVDLIYLNLQGIPLTVQTVGDFLRVLKDDGVVAIEDRHLYDDARWNATIESLKQRFKEIEVSPEFRNKTVEYGVRPNKDYGKKQELCEEESSVVDSEEEMMKLVSSNKVTEGFVDEIRYSVLKKI